MKTAGFISFPIAPIKFATCVMFLSISHQIRFCTSSDNVCSDYLIFSDRLKSFSQKFKIFDFSKKQGYSLCCFCNFRKFWKVSRQTNAYMSNKWPLKLSGAYLNTQGSSPSGTPLKWIDNG
ncbi:hypothetical protein T03_13093 [Trichinella britovi]|uniref:Uncharacterized protein n=1 Tax=Trichinella britovi TaxID=45882 RepID=A0A0V1BSZ6_TRIBR|nr:hypothetical protein T03_13093 [Trichinella britovi]